MDLLNEQLHLLSVNHQIYINSGSLINKLLISKQIQKYKKVIHKEINIKDTINCVIVI